jgi:predicted kinase
MLVVIGGLPGSGKTTISREIALGCGATYLRIDTIEQAVRRAEVLAGDIGAAGYEVAYALAEENLQLGRMVVADGVNPLAITREAWRSIAAAASSAILEVEIVCSDAAVHRRRVESRPCDIPGLPMPSWESVMAHEYEPWTTPRLVIDTAL